MFDRLEDLLIRFEELMSELSEPDVANNPARFRKLMKEQSVQSASPMSQRKGQEDEFGAEGSFTNNTYIS